MSERIGFTVDIEGADETLIVMNSIMSDVTKVTSLVGTADYAFMSWQRTVEDFNILSFTRSIVATITLLRTLISVTELATAAQHALNAAQAAGSVTSTAGLASQVTGAVPLLGLFTAGALGGFALGQQVIGPALFGARGRYEWTEETEYKAQQRRQREAYRSVIPG